MTFAEMKYIPQNMHACTFVLYGVAVVVLTAIISLVNVKVISEIYIKLGYTTKGV